MFVAAVALMVAWGITGPLFGFSDTLAAGHQHRTTIVTFLMVFLIQNTQNRDTEAMQLKLDELIRATRGAHNAMLDLEELEEERLAAFRAKYAALARFGTAHSGIDLDDGPGEAPRREGARRAR